VASVQKEGHYGSFVDLVIYKIQDQIGPQGKKCVEAGVSEKYRGEYCVQKKQQSQQKGNVMDKLVEPTHDLF
jgi:hypothetical protein